MASQFPSFAGSFGSETNQAIGTAFERAWKIMEASGSLLVQGENAEATRHVLAKRIIDLVRQGERDPVALCTGALELDSDSGVAGYHPKS